jgi:hypothetical protein
MKMTRKMHKLKKNQHASNISMLLSGISKAVVEVRRTAVSYPVHADGYPSRATICIVNQK